MLETMLQEKSQGKKTQIWGGKMPEKKTTTFLLLLCKKNTLLFYYY